jgi:hypothetical protein
MRRDTHAHPTHTKKITKKPTSLVNEVASLSACAAATADHPAPALPGGAAPLPPAVAATHLATAYEALGDCAASLDAARHDRLLGAVLGVGVWRLPKVRKKEGKKTPPAPPAPPPPLPPPFFLLSLSPSSR